MSVKMDTFAYFGHFRTYLVVSGAGIELCGQKAGRLFRLRASKETAFRKICLLFVLLV